MSSDAQLPISPSASQRSANIHNGDNEAEDVVQHIHDANEERDVDARSLSTVEQPPSETEKLSPAKIYAPLSFPVLAILAPASVFGVLARLGLQALTTFDGQSIFSLAYVQTLGCFIMGVCFGLKEPIGQFYGPFYTALTTGFCGSLTTFSGWQYDVFASWINSAAYDRGGLRDAIDGITKTVVTLALSVGGFLFGTRLGSSFHRSAAGQIIFPTNLLPRVWRYSVSMLSVLVYAATIPAYFQLPAAYRHQATATLLFSYPGTLSRYLLSTYLNPRWKMLPLGTFTANVVGTALLGAFHVLQNRHAHISPHTCSILQGLIDGYCGCLTTVSTFAAEISALPERKRWFYLIVSYAAGQLTLLIIMEPSFHVGMVNEARTCGFT